MLLFLSQLSRSSAFVIPCLSQNELWCNRLRHLTQPFDINSHHCFVLSLRLCTFWLLLRSRFGSNTFHLRIWWPGMASCISKIAWWQLCRGASSHHTLSSLLVLVPSRCKVEIMRRFCPAEVAHLRWRSLACLYFPQWCDPCIICIANKPIRHTAYSRSDLGLAQFRERMPACRNRLQTQ